MSSSVRGAFRALPVLAVSLVVGCKTMTQSEIKFLETRELDLPYDNAYKAAANGLFSLGFAIDHSDKESGILSARQHDPRTGLKVSNAIFFGVIGLAATESVDHAITFMLTSVNPTLTELRMKVVRNGKAVVDRKLMTKIWQTIEREAMLATRPVTDRTAQAAPASSPEPHGPSPP